MMKFKVKSFTHNGITIKYIDEGSGQNLLFLHGWGIRARTYDKLLKLLLPHYRVIAPDLPGFGASNTPDHVWNFGEYAEYLDAFIRGKKLQNIILMGHSTGGGIALYLAARNNSIKKLIPVDAAGMPVEYNRVTIYFLYMKQVFKELLKPRNFKVSLIATRDYLGNVTHFTYIFGITKKITTKEIATDKSVFQSIAIPTLILWGDEDRIFTKVLAELLHKYIKQAQLMYVKGSHDWIIFYPEQILNFLHKI
jgi:pimeloyl-ACP methyl ester carboxylesterase